MDDNVEFYIERITPEEVLSALVPKEKTILHIGGDPSLATLTSATKYTRIELSELDKIGTESGFDYVVLSDVLELVDDPIGLIKQVKRLATATIIYEYKYDEGCKVRPEFKKPWETIGLAYNISFNYDFHNCVFLGYATVHTCDTPYDAPTEDSK